MTKPKKPADTQSKKPRKSTLPAKAAPEKPKQPLTRRPWSLTPERLNTMAKIANPENETKEALLTRGLQAGMPVAIALQLAGIDKRVYAEWLQRTKNPDQLEKYPELAEFQRIAQQIEARNYLFHLENIKALASGERTKGWFAASCWYLERRLPDYFALKRQTLNTEVNIDVKAVIRDSEQAAIDYARIATQDEPITVPVVQEPPTEQGELTP
ncbi:MAG: hypothetical protein ACP5XB_23645 [Isosphaeraceae bacterium]